MEEIFAEKAITLWGPFAMIVILLVLVLVVLGRQYLSRQKAYEERDEKRLSMFMAAVGEFTQQAIETRKSVEDNNTLTRELKELVRDVHTWMVKFNERF